MFFSEAKVSVINFLKICLWW